MAHDPEKLKEIVIFHSVSDTWESAKREWKLKRIFLSQTECLCGHDIMENCVIVNINNHHELIVGNVCINNFENEKLTVPPSAFDSLRKLGPDSKANKALINLAVEAGIITTESADFYNQITSGNGGRKHYDRTHEKFSEKKYDIRKRINLEIYLGFKNDGSPHCECDLPMTLRQSKLGYFYGCRNYPKGCRKTRGILERDILEFESREDELEELPG